MEITKTINTQIEVLEDEISWLSEVLDTRLKLYFEQDCEYLSITDIEPPLLENNNAVYASIVRHYQMDFAERLILILALVPHLRPQLLDIFFTKNATYDRGFTEFGGIKGSNHGGFIPTAETAVFVLCGNDLALRLKLMRLFSPDHFFYKMGIFDHVPVADEEPILSHSLVLSRNYLSYLLTGEEYKPDYGTNFPAKRITTPLDWDDLVLEKEVLEDIHEIQTWIQNSELLLKEWGLGKKIKRGYRSLFYGPPGTGKTLTTTLLGKSTGMDVYRVDLSLMVSKYIGETEKNLSKVFDQAENKNWILFFDEADALFGKRTQTTSSNDRHANQEVSFLLQKIEDFPGVVILATNLKSNLDEAFARRFQSVIYFSMPTVEQRYSLWKNALDSLILHEDVNLKYIAEKHVMAGGSIINVLRYVALKALNRGNNIVLAEDIESGIKREFRKEGKGA